MSNPIIPIDRHDAKESGRAIQEMQNTVMETGTAATLALIRELLKSLKLLNKPVKVEIAINDSVAYQANAQADDKLDVHSADNTLSEPQIRYLKDVVKLPQSDEPAVASIPLDQNVTITVDGQEVFRLKDGIVENNRLVPTIENVQEKPRPQPEILVQPSPKTEQNAQVEILGEENPEITQKGSTPVEIAMHRTENSVEEAPIEILTKERHEKFQTDVSLSNDQRQALKKLGINPQTVENAMGEKIQGNVPIILVLNRELDRKVSRSQLKDNLHSLQSRLQKTFEDLSRKIFSFLGNIKEKFFPATERAVKQDLQNLAVINVAARLLDRFGSQSQNGVEVFEGNTFRLERQEKNITVMAKDGRADILSLKDGQLSGSLSQKDIEKFQAVDLQFNQQHSRRLQAEIG
jgi:hypothetical protein